MMMRAAKPSHEAFASISTQGMDKELWLGECGIISESLSWYQVMEQQWWHGQRSMERGAKGISVSLFVLGVLGRAL